MTPPVGLSTQPIQATPGAIGGRNRRGQQPQPLWTRRWPFGDQLGPHFVEDTDDRVLMIETRRVVARRRCHRRQAYLMLSAMGHRAAELGDGSAM